MKLIAVILHLGEIEFNPRTWDNVTDPDAPGEIQNPDRAKIIASLLGY